MYLQTIKIKHSQITYKEVQNIGDIKNIKKVE